jgi:hypothetical protein
VVGLGVAFAGLKGLLALAPEGLPVAVGVRMDATVLAFTALAAIAAGILFGVAPAWQISRLDRYELLKEGGRANTAGLGRQHLRAALVVAEVALALVLLVGAGLFLRSLAALEDVNPGFQPNGVITAGLSLPQTHYADRGKRIAFFRAVLGNLAAMPGVTSAAAAVPVPFSGDGGSASFAIEGRPSPPGDPGPHGDVGYVTPDYFAALKIPIRKGRVFTDLDRQDTEPVVLVDETLAANTGPAKTPSASTSAAAAGAMGHHRRRGGHVKNADLGGEDVKGKYYFPLYQDRAALREVRGANALGPGAPGGRHSRRGPVTVDPTQPVRRIRLLPDMVAVRSRRAASW